MEKATQSQSLSDVHVPSAVRFMTKPFVMASTPRRSEVRVGTMMSLPSSRYELFGDDVVISNSPLPKPPTWTSCCQMDESSVSPANCSSRTRQYLCLGRER